MSGVLIRSEMSSPSSGDGRRRVEGKAEGKAGEERVEVRGSSAFE